MNSYNVYGKQPIKDHRKWIQQIPGQINEYLSKRHCRNGLVIKSSETALQNIQDYGRLSAITHESGVAVFNIDPDKENITQLGSKENVKKAKEEFENLANAILDILGEY